jgi:hypothetical protein
MAPKSSRALRTRPPKMPAIPGTNHAKGAVSDAFAVAEARYGPISDHSVAVESLADWPS